MNQPANTVEEDGPITRIVVHKVNGETITVVMDTDDARRLPGKIFHAGNGPGSLTSYVAIWDGVNKKPIHLHRWIMGAREDQEVDHENRDGLDNRKANLRFCVHRQNISAATKKGRNKTGFIGVREDKRCRTPKFDALMAGKMIGRFTSAEAAARARDAAARMAYSEFAVLNFPEETA